MSILRNIAKKGGLLWAFVAIIPFATIAGKIFRSLAEQGVCIPESIRLMIVIPLFLIQLFGLFLLFKYRNEII